MQCNFMGNLLMPETMFRYADKRFVNGEGQTDWNRFAISSDGKGFDIRQEIIPDYVLKAGKVICRYGSASGAYTCPEGTPYEEISLPYMKESVPYHEYEVMKDISVQCVVTKGVAAPNFFCSGGGTQYLHGMSIMEEMERGAIKEVFGWIKK